MSHAILWSVKTDDNPAPGVRSKENILLYQSNLFKKNTCAFQIAMVLSLCWFRIFLLQRFFTTHNTGVYKMSFRNRYSVMQAVVDVVTAGNSLFLKTETVLKQILKMDLNEKVEGKDGKNEFKKIGTAEVPIPMLEDFGIKTEFAKNDKGAVEVDDEGVPNYADPVYNWLQGAIISAVKAQTRNKYAKGVLKENAKLATTFAELIAVGERDGAALQARHDCRKAFAAYLEADGRAPTVVKLLSDLFIDTNSIGVAKDAFVAALKHHVPKFFDGLSEVDMARYERTITKALQALDAGKSSMDDLIGTQS
jgi:hypothetical protein